MQEKKIEEKPEEKKPELSEVEKLKQKCQEYLDGWQRAKADYQNLQKETVKEKESFATYARTSFVVQLLPLYNNFQMAFEHLPDNLKDDDWVQGILHIKDQFSGLLKDLKVERIKIKNQKFDATIHEAVEREKSELEAGSIIREVTAGYMLDGEVLTPAKVVVSE